MTSANRARRVCILGLMAVAGGLAGCSDALVSPRHVILISLDTLRADRLSVWGHDRTTDPALARLAGDAVVFETVASQASQTLLSHKSLFAAKYPLRIVQDVTGASFGDLGAIEPARANDFLVNALSRARGSLVDALRAQGYLTAAFTDGGWLRSRFGFDDGFDHYDDQGGHLAGILPRARAWIDRHREGSFFLFIHAYDVHKPFWSREPFNSRYCRDHSRHVDLERRLSKRSFAKLSLSPGDIAGIADHYDGGIQSADAYLGELFDYLERQGIYRDSLIVVTSDHGESLGEHGLVGHGALYLEQVHVPLIIKFPAGAIAARRVGEPVELLDVMPTVLDVCAAEVPDGLDGRSLLPLIRDGAPHRRFLTSQIHFKALPDLISNPVKRSIWQPGRWLVVVDGRSGHWETFNLAEDPKGLRDVSGEEPPQARALLEILRRAESTTAAGSFSIPQAVDLDEQTRRELRSLGYLE